MPIEKNTSEPYGEFLSSNLRMGREDLVQLGVSAQQMARTFEMAVIYDQESFTQRPQTIEHHLPVVARPTNVFFQRFYPPKYG